MNYKKTLNLPKTKFPMRANLSVREVEQLNVWKRMSLYDQIIEKSKNKKKFILHDGPPYANGHIHLGTAMNKILKDIIIRFKQMMGFKAEYIPGWDCHGLPIEHNVDKKLGTLKKQMTKLQIRKFCKKYAKKFIKIQKNEFKRLGIMGRWENPYLTINKKYEASIVKEFYKFAKNGNLFRNKKPIHWCYNCTTALAEAEIEYYEATSHSIYVKFIVINPDLINSIFKNKKVSIVIWTTTPWTIPSNLSVTLHPDLMYSAIEIDNNEIYILAKDLVKKCMENFKILKYKVILEFKSNCIEKKYCEHPLYNKKSLITLGDHVSLDSGTGCIHTAPGHGREDYIVGVKYGLQPYSPVDENGFFDQSVHKFKTKFIFDTNIPIINELKKNNLLILEEKIKHSYPHCWRCHKPVIFRATPQWFISLEKNFLRKKILSSISKVNWIPKWGEKRIYKMIEDRPDWCISRQRTWGVPIPIFYCKKCMEPIIENNIINNIINIFKKHGSDSWFEITKEELIPNNYRCTNCNEKKFVKETDILDVWFDSGVSNIFVLKNNTDLEWPADLYLEGSDQHRGWFQSSLIISLNSQNAPPFKNVITHGFVVDTHGKKMSKSIGNVISPKEIIDEYGSEILRLWVASSNYRDDIRISKNILNQLTDAYRRIRNTNRFLIGNIQDFNPKNDLIEYNKMLEIDRYAMHELQFLLQRITILYEKYEFHNIFHKIYDYCTITLSSFYLDVIKDRLYTQLPNSLERRSAQSSMYIILTTISRVIAPILIFTSEEIWSNIPNKNKETISIHLEQFPKIKQNMLNNNLSKKWEAILEIRSKINSKLEDARKNKLIGHSLEAKVIIIVLIKNDITKTLIEYEKELRSIFIVSEVEIIKDINEKNDQKNEKKLQEVSIIIKQSKNLKCERCWIHDNTVKINKKGDQICNSCKNILNRINKK